MRVRTLLTRMTALLMFAAIPCLTVACAGGGKTPVESTGGSDTSGDVGLPSIERHIHSIGELNQTEYPLDSAAGEEAYSRLAKNYRESYELSNQKLGGVKAYYPRIKTLADGSYLMIFHNTRWGQNVYVAKSKDCIEWETPTAIFTQKDVTIDDHKNVRYYMTPDACVLSDGRILAVTSFRPYNLKDSTDYKEHPEESGLAIRISADGGKTWSEEQIIYRGTNWEPSVMQDKNGEIYVLFTCTAGSIYDNRDENGGLSKNFECRSGSVGLVRSTDGGKSWTPFVTEAPFMPQYVMRQYTHTFENGIRHYTDQMPVAVLLHNGTIALSAESGMPTGMMMISLGYFSDGFKNDLGLHNVGPADRQSNIFGGMGPYIAQFDSGETVLTYHGSSLFYRLGDANARNFGNAVEAIDGTKTSTGTGYWGCVETTSSHSAVMAIGTGFDGDQLKVARFYLNHRLHAKKMTPSLIADTAEWDGNTDALFCGSKSQAQVALRVGYDDENVYLLAERLDRQICSNDSLMFYLADGTEEGYYRLSVGNEGILSVDYKAKNSAQAIDVDPAQEGIRAVVYVDGTVDDRLDADNGVIYEIAFPRKLLGEKDELRLLFDLINSDRPGEEETTEMVHPDASFRDKSKWFAASFE